MIDRRELLVGAAAVAVAGGLPMPDLTEAGLIAQMEAADFSTDNLLGKCWERYTEAIGGLSVSRSHCYWKGTEERGPVLLSEAYWEPAALKMSPEANEVMDMIQVRAALKEQYGMKMEKLVDDKGHARSSNIEEIGHDPETNTLAVKFKDGGVYHYEDVDAEKHKALMADPSIGGHLNAKIKGQHKFKKVDISEA